MFERSPKSIMLKELADELLKRKVEVEVIEAVLRKARRMTKEELYDECNRVRYDFGRVFDY